MTLAGNRLRQKPVEPAGKTGPPRAADLLAWYDRHRRSLPWRAAPGEKADPYRVWLSEIMLQQTTVKAVVPYFTRFATRFPTVGELAAAERSEVLRLWAGLGYYARARNMHECAKAVIEGHGGRFPETETELAALPGIGAYTAAAIAAIAFDRPAVAIDGNVERVVTRLFAVEDELPAAKPAIKRLAGTLLPQQRTGDFAQAMMDLGATICTPKRPACVLCPWQQTCAARARGNAEGFPRKARKKSGELRRGAAFVVLRADGHVLVRTRANAGLLGGMTEVPTTEWSVDFDAATAVDQAPLAAEWRKAPGVVSHIFTHFPLELIVYVATVAARINAPRGTRFVAIAELDGEAFPNLMRKVLTRADLNRAMNARRRAHSS